MKRARRAKQARLNRRGLLRLAGAGAAAWAVSGLRFSVAAAAKAKRPNIVVFLSDDHGVLDSTVYGATDVRTPNMRRLAKAGLTFAAAFVASPSCAPSRAAMLTGLMPARNGAEANHSYCRAGIKTIPAYLHALGYEVAAFGKVAHGRDATRHGFDRHDPRYDAATVGRYLDGRNSGKPLCLLVGTHQPHVPWPPSDGYDPARLHVPPTHVDTPETREYRARYYTDVTIADTELGQIHDLARKKLGGDTLLIYTSDQGAQWPLGKWNLYDAGIRTPLIAVWPGVIQPGTQTGAMVSWVDLLPTFVEAAGGTPPKDIDGRSFAAVLRGRAETHRKHIFATHSGDGRMNVYPIRCVRTERYKYILNLRPDCRHTTHIDLARGKDGLVVWRSWERAAETDAHAAAVVRRYAQRPREELYDLDADPRETRNLAASGEHQHQETLKKLRALLADWMARQGDTKRVFNQPYLLKDPKPVAQGVRESAAGRRAAPDAAQWRYTTKKPAAGWEKPGFDDSAWQAGRSGFGRIKQPSARVRTPWRTSDIWLRRTFQLKAPPARPRLVIFHDEDAEVYINGVWAAKLTGHVVEYKSLPIRPAAVKALRPGRNTLAVHCRQTIGGQYIDVALADAAKP